MIGERDATTKRVHGAGAGWTDDGSSAESPADAPEADAPEADAPEADAPETDAPEADAPESDAPENASSLQGKSVMRQYAALFRAPGVAPLIFAMIIARMPTGCTTMLLVLFVSMDYGAATAGAASAAWTIGLAILAPYLGRLVDHGFGPRVLCITAVADALSMAALICLVFFRAPAWMVLLAAFLSGALNPPISGTTRSLWKMLVGDELLPVAYSFEILLIDTLYVSGPLLASVFIALEIPQVGMAATTVCLVVGTLALAASRPVKRYAQWGHAVWTQQAKYERKKCDGGSADVCEPAGCDGARQMGDVAGVQAGEVALLRHPAVWAVLVACMGAMMFSGWMETLIPLHFSENGASAEGSVVISLWSLGSIVGVLGFVRIQPALSRLSLAGQLLLFTALYLLPTTAVAFISADGFWALCICMTLVGVLVSPCTNLHYQVGGQQAPVFQHAEMFSWLNTATSAGISLGALLAGSAIETVGSQIAFDLPFVFVAASFVAALLLRKFCRA